MTLWTSDQARAATGGQVTTPWSATGVSIDTRSLQPGDLFVALTAVRDGHDFVADALSKGAAAALVSHVPEGVDDNAPLLIVSDVQEALENLGKAGRERTKARVVAVTGSVGKTSSKDMLRHVLSAQGKTHAAEASYNNHWGVPLTFARMPEDTDYAVIEIGMNHPGEIAPLARMAKPHVALVTTVADVHLEAFEDGIQGIAREKASIFEGLEPDGVAIINADIDTASILSDVAHTQNAKPVTFGETGEHFVLKDVRMADGVTLAQAVAHGDPVVYKVMSAGRHFAINALGVLAAVEALGADLAIAVSDLAGWRPYKGRGVVEIIQLDPMIKDATLTLIDDAYNANPTSLMAALDVLAATSVRGRRVAFIGDMKELGPTEQEMHAAIAKHPAIEEVDIVHCVGPLAGTLHRALPEHKRGEHAGDSMALSEQISKLVGVGDAVLVKGSLSMRMAQIVEAIRNLGEKIPETEDEVG